MTLLSWDIPLISFNGSLWDVLLRCSKWLLWAWLDSFTMILRCWLVVWVKWAPPCLYDTVIQSYVQLKSGSIERTAHFMGRPTPLKVNGANFSTLLPPGGNFTPFWGMVLQSLPASSNVANFTFLWNPLSELRGVKFFRNVKSMGQIWDAPAPQGCNFYPILRYGLTEPASLLKCGKFTFLWNPLLSYEASKFFSMLSQCVWFCPYFAPGAKHRTPDRL